MMNEQQKAKWGIDYDAHTDKIYNCPVCPECEEPIFKYNDGKYRCVNCKAEAEITDAAMLEYFREREQGRVEIKDHKKIIFEDGEEMGCDGKNCYEIHYRINPATHEREVTGGKCRQCGLTFIV